MLQRKFSADRALSAGVALASLFAWRHLLVSHGVRPDRCTPGLNAAADTASANPSGWSGYQAWGGPYSSAAADFIVPIGVCSPGQSGGMADAYWVGIQGDNGGDTAAIVQTGFALGCRKVNPSITQCMPICRAIGSTFSTLCSPAT
ncbi:hypothetical protein SAMN05892883_4168 [Jatrophihabitans sp. GAS493]|uniref:G1 family glutamic endopeptidase n=1 Tax=Jatrophihabitans sp. GAS493 TaxID=1907575 RepID=UPI000BB96E8B|nr:G1 family glutamic endopeptidase [Jatrophihabitans sp. GAS493]SOD74971.1 hypothetical protein SAMN05892883_4168 [Jatrophihabitans sp. GAS493]